MNTNAANLIRSMVPDTESIVVCSGPKQRRFLGPVCTATVVDVAKRL